MECCLLKKCANEHKEAPPKYTYKLYRVGKLLGGQALCVWCLLHIQDLVKPIINDGDHYKLEQLKQKFPNYWNVIQEEGIDNVRFELGMQWLEAEPDSLPSRPEQLYPKTEVTVEGIRGEKHG